MWSYKNRIERDLLRWRDNGWVTTDGAAAIAADLKSQGGTRIANVLSTLAAVLIGFAVMSFVAANWQDMPKWLRLGVIFSFLWMSFIGAAMLFRQGQNGFAHAATLVGSATFGAGIMLISQMYHMDGNPPDALLLWSGGALVAGLLLRSPPSVGFAMVLAAIWGGMETGQREEVFWHFLPVWAVISAAFYWLKWPTGLHLSSLAMTLFIISLGAILGRGHKFELVLVIGLALTALCIAGEKLQPHMHRVWPKALPYALIITFVSLLALQFGELPTLNEFVMYSVVALALALAAIWWGVSSSNSGALWVGYIAFSIEVLAIYQKTVGSLMGTSLFFLIAGLIVAALAVIAMKLANRTAKEALS